MIHLPQKTTLFPYTTLFRSYNTITSNCTTLVYRMARQLNPGLPMDIRLLLTGYLQGYLRDNGAIDARSEEHTSELQSHVNLVCRLLLEKKKHTHLSVSLGKK